MIISLGLIIGIIIFFSWRLIREKDQQNNEPKNVPDESEAEIAVLYIETAAKFVKENQSILNCNQITMWQYGEEGEGFSVEFYGFAPIFRQTIEKLLADIFGTWQLWEDSDEGVLHITGTGVYAYRNSWGNFNKAVWSEVQRKHPEWKIEKPFSHKYVLYI